MTIPGGSVAAGGHEGASRGHVSSFEVTFGDCDPAGIVFYPNFFRWMDAATHSYFRAMGVPPWREVEAATGMLGTPLVDASARFVAPASYGDVIDVETRVTEWRQRSIVLAHTIRRGAALLVEGREVRVFARKSADDPTRIVAVAIPEDIRRLCGAPERADGHSSSKPPF